MEAKVRINLKEGILELEGSEEFVSKYLELYKEKLLTTPLNNNITEKKEKSEKPKTNKKKKEVDPTKKKTSPKKIEIEKFSFEGDSKKTIPSLKDFLNEKKVDDKSAPKFIVTVGYYITTILELDEFSEGNIEYAYKALGFTNRPAHLHQIIINQKNSKNWFEEGSSGNRWKISRIGEIYVEGSLKDD